MTKICVVGPVELDTSGSGQLNGPAATAARALRGVQVTPILMTGDDAHQEPVQRLSREEFGESAQTLPNLEYTPLRNPENYRIAGKLPACVDQGISWPVWKKLRDDDLAIVCPLPPDAPKLLDDLQLATKSVMLFGLEQLSDPFRANDLARRAWFSACTVDQTALWLGTRDPMEAIRRLEQHGCRKMAVVDGRSSVVAYDGEFLFHTGAESCGENELPRQIGTFVSELCAGANWQDAWIAACRSEVVETETIPMAAQSQPRPSRLRQLAVHLQPIAMMIGALFSQHRG